MKRLVFAFLVLSTLVPGCGCPSSELKKRKPRDASPVVELPAGSRWKTAKVVVTVSYTEREYSGRNFGTQTTITVSSWLVLAGAEGDRKIRIVPDSTNSMDTGALLTLADAPWKLEVLDGGRGIAGARPGDKEWSWVALDGPAPFTCRHIKCGPTSAPPVAGPRAREVLLQMFASPGQRAPHADPVDYEEWLHAADVATAEPADPELRRALAAAALRHDSGFTAQSVDAPALGVLSRLVASDPALQKKCIEAIAHAVDDPVCAANAASLLQDSTDDEVAIALARGLKVVYEKSRDGGAVARCRVIFAYGLARFAEARHELPGEVPSILTPLLAAEPRRGDAGPLYLVYAAALSGDPGLRFALSSISLGLPEGKVPAWPANLEDLRLAIRDKGWSYDVTPAQLAKAAPQQ